MDWLELLFICLFAVGQQVIAFVWVQFVWASETEEEKNHQYSSLLLGFILWGVICINVGSF